jgi:hypothetical protein
MPVVEEWNEFLFTRQGLDESDGKSLLDHVMDAHVGSELHAVVPGSSLGSLAEN